MSVRFGIWVAALGGVLMIAGGLLTGRPSRAATPAAAPAPAAAAAFGATLAGAPEAPLGVGGAASVAPPGWAPPPGTA